eukprot:EG_transcript_12900
MAGQPPPADSTMEVDAPGDEEGSEDPEANSSCAEQDDADWAEEAAQETQDLFSEERFPSCAECLQYMRQTYGFDLLATVRHRGLDLFSAIKYVNAIRWAVADGATFPDVEWSEWPVPDDERFLLPVVDADPLLQIVDIDDEDDDGDVPPCPTVLALLQRDLAEYRHASSLLHDEAGPAASAWALTLDEACADLFSAPPGGGPPPVPMAPQEFEWRLNAEYNERCAVILGSSEEARKPWPALEDGCAPFIKHLVVSNFVPGFTVTVAEVTEANHHLLCSGYQAGPGEDLPVLDRWLPRGSVPQPEARFLHLTLLSRDHLRATWEATGRSPSPKTSPWGIVSIHAASESAAVPLPPAAVMHAALAGGHVDRPAYLHSVEYWARHARIA